MYSDTKFYRKTGGPLSAGAYSAIITDVEEKLTKAGNGKYLKVTLVVVDDAREGFQVICNIMLEHPKEASVKHGKRLLKNLLEAVGIDSSHDGDLDTSSLVGQMVVIVVTIKDCGPDYGRKNEVRAFKKAAAFNAMSDDSNRSENLDRIPF